MPTGKLTDPGGPGAQYHIGTVKGTDGKYYPFANSALYDLEIGDPIVFTVNNETIRIENREFNLAVAVLLNDSNGVPLIIKGDWTTEDVPNSEKKYDKIWEKEWERATEEDIVNNLELRDEFRDSTSRKFKDGLKKLTSFADIEQRNPRT